MEYQKETNVISLGDHKQAALYFDRVIPVDGYLFPSAMLGPFDCELYDKAYHKLSNSQFGTLTYPNNTSGFVHTL